VIGPIFRANKVRILLIYALFLVEFVLFAFLPFFLGKGVDGVLSHQMKWFWIFVGIGALGEIVGFARRIIDTRVFVGIWATSVGKSICGMIDRNLKTELIINRSYLVRHYSDFFEYTMPTGFSSIVNIVISCCMIIAAAHASGVILVIMALSMAICYYLSGVIQKSELAVQESRELVGDAIGARDKDKIVKGYHLMGRRLIGRSNLDAVAWSSTSSFSLLSQVIVVLLVANAGHTLGTIMACIAYTDRIFQRVDVLGMLLNQWKQVEIANQLLEVDRTSSEDGVS
jgi:hypothetical protein